MSIFASSDLIRAKQRMAQHNWAANIFSAVRARADAWLAHPVDVPTLAGGWVHDYICPEHWTALVFDAQSPHAHRCLAGETRTGDKLDAAWRVLEHRRIANTARDLGLVYTLTNERAYANCATEIQRQYANNYALYAGAGQAQSWMLRGHVFNQALTEAIWSIPIVHAYDLMRATLAPRQAAHIVEKLLRPMAETMIAAQDQLVYQEKNLKSNYNAWLIAAIGLLGYALNDDTLVERAINSDAGFRAHLSAAILPDGFEYEGTPYYHNFVALAYSILAEAARANGRDLYAERGTQGQSIESMWRAMASLAFADGTIPAINDGAYHEGGAFLSEICETYEIAFARTGAPEYAWLLNNNTQYAIRNTWSALLFAERDITNAPPPQEQSVCLPDVGIAVLRDEQNAIQVCVLFGAYAGSHSHYDRLAPQIFPFATDPGTPFYGIAPRVDWYQQTAAHNAIVVDGKSQEKCGGNLIEWKFENDTTTLRLTANDAFPGVKFARAFALSKKTVVDVTELESDEEHTYDWILHLDGKCFFDLVDLAQASGTLANDGAYKFANVLAHGTTRPASFDENPLNHVVRATIKHSGKIFGVSVNADVNSEIIVASSPAHVGTPPQARQMLIVRTRAKRAAFLAQYDGVK